MSDEQKRHVAAHEAGHVIVAKALPSFRFVQSVHLYWNDDDNEWQGVTIFGTSLPVRKKHPEDPLVMAVAGMAGEIHLMGRRIPDGSKGDLLIAALAANLWIAETNGTPSPLPPLPKNLITGITAQDLLLWGLCRAHAIILENEEKHRLLADELCDREKLTEKDIQQILR